MTLEFANDEKARAFCDEIICHLIAMYGMTSSDARTYVAQQWAGQPFEGDDDMRYHELPEEWAEHIHKYHDYLFGHEMNRELPTSHDRIIGVGPTLP